MRSCEQDWFFMVFHFSISPAWRCVRRQTLQLLQHLPARPNMTPGRVGPARVSTSHELRTSPGISGDYGFTASSISRRSGNDAKAAETSCRFTRKSLIRGFSMVLPMLGALQNGKTAKVECSEHVQNQKQPVQPAQVATSDPLRSFSRRR